MRPGTSPSLPTPPTTAKVQESTGKINELLRHADVLLKQGDADSALILIREARALEPAHAYGEAMEERILRWIAERQQRATPAASVPSASPSTTPPPVSAPQLPATTCVASPAPTEEAVTRRANRTGRAVVLLIDDDELLRSALQEAIERGGYEAIGVGTAEEALVLLHRLTPDAIICDVNLETSRIGGFTLFEKIQAIEPLRRVPFMFLTGLHDDVLLRTGKELGADDYLRKPITEADLLSVLRGKIRRYRRLSGAVPGVAEHVTA